MSGLKCVAEDPRFWIDFAEKFDDGETRAGFEILVVDIDPFVAGKSANGDEDILF